MTKHRHGLFLTALVLTVGIGAAPLGAASPAGWTPADPPTGPGAMAPSLTVAGDALLLTWLEPVAPAAADARAHALRFARWHDGRWSSPATIATGPDFFANWADFPAVAQAPDGSLTAHWLAKIGAETYAYGIFLARSTDAGATWKPAGLLHSDRLPTEHGFVSWLPEASPEGGLRAFWLDGRQMLDGGPMTLRTGIAGREGAEELLDAKVCDCCQTDAALTSGGPVVAYRDRSDKEVRDISVVRRTASGWSEPTRVHADDWEIPGCPVNGPAIAAVGERVAVAWFTGAPPGPRVQVAFSRDAGAHFGPAVPVDGEAPLGRVDLQLVPSGDAIVSWLGVQGEEKEGAVRLRRVSPSGRAGAPLTLAATTAARASGFPRTALHGDRFWLAWVDDTGEGEPSRIRVAHLPLTSIP